MTAEEAVAEASQVEQLLRERGPMSSSEVAEALGWPRKKAAARLRGSGPNMCDPNKRRFGVRDGKWYALKT